jgi:diaminopimelate epimerase
MTMGAKIPFLKMSGAGNDFIVIDNRAGLVPEPAGALAARLCARRDAIGADGLLLLEKSGRADFRMRYYNADGSEADMCGNGARCISRFALLCGAAKQEMRFENLAGDFKSLVDQAGQVALDMTAPHSEALNLRIEQDGLDLLGHSLNTGVPHLVLEWPGLSAAPVVALGRKLRHHAAFAPKGTNVNFVEVTGPQSLKIRTYERGVEDETLACGTGSVAAAILMARAGRVKAPVTLTTLSGGQLEVRFTLQGGQAVDVQLIGDARVRFAGEFDPAEFGC